MEVFSEMFKKAFDKVGKGMVRFEPEPCVSCNTLLDVYEHDQTCEGCGRTMCQHCKASFVDEQYLAEQFGITENYCRCCADKIARDLWLETTGI